MVYIKNKILKFGYTQIIKKVCFCFEAEKVHELFILIGKNLGKNNLLKRVIQRMFLYEHPILEQKILGMKFRNPVGLAAGFDYNADLIDIIPSVGFGFQSIGSITSEACFGNKKPRLGRLPKSKALYINKGLKNAGAEKIIKGLKTKKPEIPVFISIAKTNCKRTVNEQEGVKDYISSLRLWAGTRIGDIYELNISCPNSFGGESFTSKTSLNKLLEEVNKLRLKKPVFLKMPTDIAEKKAGELCFIALRHNVQGVIIGNLTKDRNQKHLKREEVKRFGSGSFSGLPCGEKSDKLIKYIYKKYGTKLIIIGCGGIFSAEDSYRKIKNGASLVQLITGMIYEGPGLISEINQELVELLKKDKYKNISEAIGADAKKA